MTITDIKDSKDLKEVLESEKKAREAAEAKADAASKEVSEVRAEAKKTAETFEDMAKKIREEAKADREKLQEALSKNFVEKYSTMQAGTKEETLYNFGKFYQAIVNKDAEGIKKYGLDKKGGGSLTAMQEQKWNESQHMMQKATIGTPLTSDATTGNYLVPVEYMGEVMYVAKQNSQLMGKVREIPMVAITKYVPTQDAAAACAWIGSQGSANTEVNPTFSRVTLTSKTMGIFTTVNEEFDEDSLVSFAAYFRDLIGEAWGYEFDYQCTRSNADPFTGMLNGATNVLTMAAGQSSFEDVTFDDLYDLISELTTVNKRTGGVFIMHCTIFDILRKLKNANGDYIYQPPAGTQPGTICGYPYIITDAMTPLTSDAASTKFLIFGNPKHFLFGNRIGMEFKLFDQTYVTAQYNAILFRCRLRAAFITGIASALAVLKTAA